MSKMKLGSPVAVLIIAPTIAASSEFGIVGFDGRLRPVALNATINDGEIHLRGRKRRLWPLLCCSASTTPCTA